MTDDLRFTSGKFCSLSSKGTFTELPTNTTVLSSLQIRNHLAEILNGKIPLTLLPDVLHEFTHHWCFLSPVGSALAAVRIRTLQRAISAKTAQPLFEDVFRYETACAMLRPIAEGLALFSEFDVVPGTSMCRSPVMMWVLSYFRREAYGADFSEQEADKQLTSLLSAVRQIEDVWRKKESLLAKPIGLDNGGYLDGYLALKNVWNKYHKQIGDAELFLSYIRSFFFDDYQLVRVLLDPNIAFYQTINDLLAYIDQRLHLLHETDLEEAIAQYHEKMRSFHPTRDHNRLDKPTFLPGLLVDGNKAAEGAELAKELFLEVQQDIPGVPKVITDYSRYTLGRRELVCIASSPAHVTINEHRRVIAFAEDFIFGGPALPDVEQTSGEGAVEIYFSTLDIETFDAVVTTLKGRPVGVRFGGKESPDKAIVEEFLSNYLDRSIVISSQERIDNVIETLLLKQPAGKTLSEVRDMVKRHVDQIYLDSLFYDGLPNIQETLTDDLQAHGLWRLLGANLELLGSTAIASTANVAGLQNDEIKSLIAKHGVRYDDVVNNLISLKETTGLNFLDEDNKKVLL